MEVLSARELRIGNLLEAYIEPQVSEWIEIEVGVETLGLMESKPESHGFRPIPLTEEWLLKFGFNRESSHIFFLNVLSKGTINALLNFSKTSISIEIGTVGGYLVGYPKIKYIHQLQNLYFALKGEELKVKL